MNKEVRQAQNLELRADEGEPIKVSGYAAVFNSEANIGGYYNERIERGAFSEAIGRDDVVFLINHEGLPLARTTSGTLTLREDDHGLYMETELDSSDPEVKSIVPKMKRGDLSKMSFAFYSEDEEWDEIGAIPTRTVKKASLADVSIVTFPAYDSTEIGLRSLEEYRSANKTTGIKAKTAKMRMRLALSQGVSGSRSAAI